MNMGSGSGTSLPFTCWARLTTTKQKTTICKNWLMHGLPFDYSVLSISCMYATCPSVTWISENDQTEPLRKLLLSFLSGSQLSNSFTPSQKFEFFFWLTHATRQSHRAAANCQIVRSFLNHHLFRKLKGWSFSDFFFSFFYRFAVYFAFWSSGRVWRGMMIMVWRREKDKCKRREFWRRGNWKVMVFRFGWVVGAVEK